MKKIDFVLLIKGLICYGLGCIGALIILIISQEDRIIKYHAEQSIVFYLLIYVIDIFYSLIPIRIPYFTETINLFRICITVFGTYYICQRRYIKFPVLGDIVSKFFI